jgi:hypothetical protein
MIYFYYHLLTPPPHSANIPYFSLAVFTATLTEISYTKNKRRNIFKMLVEMLKYFRMDFI